MKKIIYHEGKGENEYRVIELEKSEGGEIFLRIKHGVKGDKENTEQLSMRVGYDELGGFAYRIERLLMSGGKGKATMFHGKEGDAYKVGEVEITDKGEIFFRMTEGVKGGERKQIAMRLNEDELAGIFVGARRILLS